MIATVYVGLFETVGPSGGVIERGERVAYRPFGPDSRRWSDGSRTAWGESRRVRIEHDLGSDAESIFPPGALIGMARLGADGLRLLDPDPGLPLARDKPAARPPKPRRQATRQALLDFQP